VRLPEFGGFDGRFPRAAAEDWEVCDRWRWHGGRIVSAPDAVVRHYHAMDAMSFLRQHLNYGRGAVRLRKLRRQRWGRVRWEGLLFYVKMLNYPFRHCLDRRPAAVALLMGISQLMMALGYMSELCVRGSAGGADAAR
jgi:GT2 family glycosyltransferase